MRMRMSKKYKSDRGVAVACVAFASVKTVFASHGCVVAQRYIMADGYTIHALRRSERVFPFQNVSGLFDGQQ